MTKEQLDVIMVDLLKAAKQEKEPEYKSGYVDGALDMYNKILQEIK